LADLQRTVYPPTRQLKVERS